MNIPTLDISRFTKAAEVKLDKEAFATPKMYLCSSLKGHWPVGGEAIVIAWSVEEARELLQRQVELEGLPHQIVTKEQLVEVDTATPRAIIINSGDY